MQSQRPPERPLVIKCKYGPSSKQIKFSNARNCSYEILRRKVEQSFSLPSNHLYDIQWQDQDKEDYCIDRDEALTDAIFYFQQGNDDSSHSSGSSLRGFGSRKIVVHVNVTDTDSPSLSDSGSIASAEEFAGRNDSRVSLSFDGLSQAPLDDDSMTVSSRDLSIPRHQNVDLNCRDSVLSRTRISNSRQDWLSSSNSLHLGTSTLSSTTDPFVDPSEIRSTSEQIVSPEASDAYLEATKRFPSVLSEAFERLGVHDSGSGSQPYNDRNAAWLRDQNERVFRSRLGNLPALSTSDEASVDYSYRSNSGQVTHGNLALRQNPGGKWFKYFYDYNGTSSASQNHDSGYEGVNAVDALDTVSNIDSKPDVSSLDLSWLATQQKSARSEEVPETSYQTSAQSHESDSMPSSRDYVSFDPETPPEVLQFVLIKPPHPDHLTDCSECGKELEAIRYVCKVCGENPSKRLRTLEKGKSKGASSDGSTSYHRPYHHPTSLSDPDISLPFGSSKFASSSYDIRDLADKPLPDLPNGSGSPSRSLMFDLCLRSYHGGGYELCGGCMEVGVRHAIDAGLDPGSSPSSGDASVSEWKRSAPKQKGQMRHSYIEKSWSHNGWIDVVSEQRGPAKCSTCGSSILFKQHYKCFSCDKLNLCRACYSQVHQIHPSHPFLYISEKPQLPTIIHESQLIDISSLSDEPSLKHRDVKCAHCGFDIFGARFHCAVCPSFDICSNCESTGAFSPDGDHSSSHIMIKLPYPVESNEIQNVSRRALNLWKERDAATVQFGATRQRTSSMLSTSDSRTIISSGARVSHGSSNHQLQCSSCATTIMGVRYQCANCPSSHTAFSLCETCEATSYRRHDPMHFFFKLPRPVHRKLTLPQPLPILYTLPAGPAVGFNPYNPKAYLKDVKHHNAFCDMCMTHIQGPWFRCAYCGKDLCDSCEELDTHDDTHVFLVFKSTVDHYILRSFTDLETPTASPVISYPIY